jgi:fluoroacetyl-CoA thioesterase
MKDSLSPGIEIEHEVRVTDDMAPAHLPAKVLSTPSMVGLIEGVCLAAAIPHLDLGETTVGTHISISHTGPAASGETVRIKARLVKREKRRLTFEVEVLSPRASISQGTHERAVVDLSRFAGPG